MPVLFILLPFFSFYTSHSNQSGDKNCVVCERLTLFESIKKKVSATYWTSFNTHGMTPPLIYFDDSASWLAFSNERIFKDIKYQQIICPSGLRVYKMNNRLDSVSFHMENKMTFRDTASPYYYRPVMFCSDVERASTLVPDVKNTEEWLQMVFHEYFHAFQFNHKSLMNYLRDSISLSVESLHGYYRKNKWFQDSLTTENNYLLKAIDARSIDSMKYFTRQFLETRKQRRKKFFDQFSLDISVSEIFWEKIEGTARYIEYYTGFIYSGLTYKSPSKTCDLLFNNFKNYYHKDITKQPWFYDKTQMMVGYYYVTGFNLCRLLDRLKISYKLNLFDNPATGLENYIYKQELLKDAYGMRD